MDRKEIADEARKEIKRVKRLPCGVTNEDHITALELIARLAEAETKPGS